MREVAKALRGEDAKKWTLKRVAAALGIHFDTVSGWFSNNSEIRNGTKQAPDARVKVAPGGRKLSSSST
jgi:hypothetical protein